MNPHPELVDGVDVDVVASTVRSCPGVADLDAGRLGSVVSYLPGRQLAGISVAADHITVQVRAIWGTPLPELARGIRDALAELVGGRRVDVAVSDIVGVPGDDEPDDGPPGGTRQSGGGHAWTPNAATPIQTRAELSSASTTPTAAETPWSS
ncbi:MAG: Asp23/Gls24 family envelope stress response protein [Actinomycetota bacterium]